jgi:hypothetical protein
VAAAELVVGKQAVDLVAAVLVQHLVLILLHWELIHYKHNMAQHLPAAVAAEHLGVVPGVVATVEAEL